ncbi:MAG: glycoside hydrolase family 172 protein [Phycisphaerae bacterium]
MRSIAHVSVLVLLIHSAVFPAGLDDLATVTDHTSHRASSADPSGGNEDSLVTFVPGETRTLLDTDGPGRITHMWFTAARFANHATFFRDIVIRMYWEHSPVASVEVPLGDFFALGHARQYVITSAPVCVGDNTKALNCYWPMPFQKHARIELFNNGRRSIRRVYFNIDYALGPQPPDQGLFHAEFRRAPALRTQAHERNLTGKDNYVILETEGRGQYVGCVLAVDAQSGGWWGEGDEMIFIDHADRPTIAGTGSEDYFCNAWGFQKAFSNPYYGCPLLEQLPDGGSLTTVYRWHIPDPVRFKTHIRVTIEHLFDPKVVNDYSSVAYWYQTEPIRRREPLPAADENHPRSHTIPATQPVTAIEMSATELEPGLHARGIKVRSVTTSLGAGYASGGYLEIDTPDQRVEIPVPVPADGRYRVCVKPVNALVKNQVQIGLKGGKTVTFARHDGHERNTPHVDLGESQSSDGHLLITLSGNPVMGLDHLRIERTDVQDVPAVPR